MTFEQALRMAGLLPRARDLVADGRIHRCDTEAKPGRRNGWFVLHPDGHGAWGDWGSGSGEALGHWRDETARIDPLAVARIQRQLAAQRDSERRARIDAMRKARAFWDASRPLRQPHKYIADKGLSQLGCAGLRVNGTLLVVPVWRETTLLSVQTIDETGAKRFWPGAPVKSGAFVLERSQAAVTAVVEGLATGLAVYQSMPLARVIVAFDAGNLVNVVDRIKPTGSVVIAADNDHGTEAKRGMNPGIQKAQTAAGIIGCGIAYPSGISGTDWADYMKEVGANARRRIERLILSQAKYVVQPMP